MLVILFKFIFVVICFALIGIVLIQRARGGGLAGAFGGGGSESFMGNLQNKEIVRYTTYLAAVYLVLAVSIDFIPQNRGTQGLEGLDGATPALNIPVETGEVGGEDGMEPIVLDEDLPLNPVDAPSDSAGQGQ